MNELKSLQNISTRLSTLRERARRDSHEIFHDLTLLVDEPLLRAAYQRLIGQQGPHQNTLKRFMLEELEEEMAHLARQIQQNTYEPPSLPAVDGTPMTAQEELLFLKDKVLQEAVTMLLEAIFYPELSNGSGGHRSRQTKSTALNELWQLIAVMGNGWLLSLDLDVEQMPQQPQQLVHCLAARIADEKIVQVIAHWLAASLSSTSQKKDRRSPAHGSLEALLLDLYCHHHLNDWFGLKMKPPLAKETFFLRYGENLIVGFKSRLDAQQVQSELARHLDDVGLVLCAEMKLVPFHCPDHLKNAQPSAPHAPAKQKPVHEEDARPAPARLKQAS